MTSNQNVLFFYDYFYPGYKAGGPIQSLTNLALALQGEYNVSVITSAYDLNSKKPYTGIHLNAWNTVLIPGSSEAIKVYYAGKALDKSTCQKILQEVNPSVVYFNNIYSSLFFRLPLAVFYTAGTKPKVVICPRGMLQKGALAVKPFKKKIYLTYLRLSGKVSNAYWHATNQEEADDIKKHFPSNLGIVIASNIPKPPYSTISFPAKESGQLKLVYLSLIAEKKNLLLLLQVIKNLDRAASLDIYGPVTDTGYWKLCEALINQMPGKVQFKGDVQPANVQQVLSQYHALILLTKGENFGHALYESLSVGRPVITSYFTPWNNLQQKAAGINVDISNMQDCLQRLSFLSEMQQQQYNTFCAGAHNTALQYFNTLDTNTKYHQLFS